MRDSNDFFVGYLSLPTRLSRFYKILIPILFLLGIAVALWLASGQKSPGKGIADLSGQQQMTGYLTIDPYPVLHGVGPDQRSVLLVHQTKTSANELVLPYANQWVNLSGFALQRGGWSMLQLPPNSEITQAPAIAGVDLTLTVLDNLTFEGEIIDSKCFLGAMKPGGGKVHRACASLCLRGGVPPMLVVKDAQGDRFGYLLMNEDDSSASVQLSEIVAVPIRVTGQLVQRGDLQYMRLNTNNIERLTGQALAAYGETLTGNQFAESTPHLHAH